MSWQMILAWGSPALDVVVILGLAATLWQLRRDPTAAWREYEERLREMQENLRLLVLQAEGEARDLDRRLAAHAEQLQSLAGAAPAAPRKAAPEAEARREGASDAGAVAGRARAAARGGAHPDRGDRAPAVAAGRRGARAGRAHHRWPGLRQRERSEPCGGPRHRHPRHDGAGDRVVTRQEVPGNNCRPGGCAARVRRGAPTRGPVARGATVA